MAPSIAFIESCYEDLFGFTENSTDLHVRGSTQRSFTELTGLVRLEPRKYLSNASRTALRVCVIR